MRKNQQQNDQSRSDQKKSPQQHLSEQEQRQKQALSNQGSQDRQVGQINSRRRDDDTSGDNRW